MSLFSLELYRVLKDDGSFVLNIKEKVVDGERHTYIHDLIKMMKSQGWRWTEEYIWHKKIQHRVAGLIVLGMVGNLAIILQNKKSLL